MSLLLPPSVSAGSYSGPVYSGGQCVTTGNAISPDTQSYSGTGPYGGGGSTSWGQTSTGTVTCSGPIKATFTWQPSGPGDTPPANVIVRETGTAGWTFSGTAPGTGKCSDGLGDPEVDTSIMGPHVPPNKSGTSTGIHYWVKSNPGSSFTLPDIQKNPKPAEADVSGTGSVGPPSTIGAGSASVNYTVTVSPVTITPGGATPDGSGGYAILVGQGCMASLSGIPDALLNNTANPPQYQWSVSGTTFQSWAVSSDQKTGKLTPGSGILTNATAHWYWSEAAATEKITCTVTLTPPIGQGSVLNIIPAWRDLGLPSSNACSIW